MLQSIIGVAVGGAFGSVCRFLVGSAVRTAVPGDFPWGTLLINVVGSFLIGIVFVLVAERMTLAPGWRYILMVGFLGGFTTFSSFSLESVELLEKGYYSLAAAYILGSLVLCLLATLGGLMLARHG